MKRPDKNMKVHEVLTLVAKGQVFNCPICESVMETIPSKVEEGKRAFGLFCPKNKHHYYIYAEDADRVNEVRRRMRERRAKKDQESVEVKENCVTPNVKDQSH
jgi:hypothetical protein